MKPYQIYKRALDTDILVSLRAFRLIIATFLLLVLTVIMIMSWQATRIALLQQDITIMKETAYDTH